VGAIATLPNVFSSPDAVYDEVVYTQAAHNVATAWHLTWTNQPMFVHPPVFFLLQAAWLEVTGQVRAPLIAAVQAARVLTATFGAINVGLVALLTYRLAEHSNVTRRRTLTLVAALVAAIDPVLLRYSRLAVIEPVALCLSLVALYLAWSLRGRSSLAYVSAVGLCIGAALLTKEITIFLVVSPVLFALLERDRQLLWRSLGALGVGLAFWLLFPLWAVELRLTGSFVDIHTATLKRLVGLVQITGWNRPGVSFAAAVLRSASQYVSSYAALALGLVALCWLWWRRNTTSGNFLTAWLTMSFTFGAFILSVGTLNEQFFVYVLPAGIVASVFMVDALLVRRADALRRAGRWPPRLGRWSVIACVGFGAILLTASAISWLQQYSGGNDGVDRVTRTIATSLPACTIVNGSGDSEKYSYLLGGRTVTRYAEGAAALSYGVHYFILAPHDAIVHYGNMSPALESWIRGHGTEVASFASKTYHGVELWHVRASDYNPLADVEYVPGGVYINTVGSRCGGFTVTDSASGAFFTGYRSRGGKAILGKPVTRVTAFRGGSLQVFQGAVLAAPPSGVTPPPVVALGVVAQLAEQAPAVYRRYALPPVPTSGLSATRSQQRAWLSDPQIANVFLGGTGRSAQAFDAAVQRFGRPLGPVRVLADGWVAQAFAGVVLQRPASGGPVQAASVGSAALSAGLLKLPRSVLPDRRPPEFPSAAGPTQRTSVLPFLGSLLAAVLLFATTVTVLGRRRRGRVAIEPVDESAA
jgi:4-amino-4-deoxy-L-arabinose transferase-like glycosyltransferase